MDKYIQKTEDKMLMGITALLLEVKDLRSDHSW